MKIIGSIPEKYIQKHILPMDGEPIDFSSGSFELKDYLVIPLEEAKEMRVTNDDKLSFYFVHNVDYTSDARAEIEKELSFRIGEALLKRFGYYEQNWNDKKMIRFIAMVIPVEKSGYHMQYIGGNNDI